MQKDFEEKLQMIARLYSDGEKQKAIQSMAGLEGYLKKLEKKQKNFFLDRKIKQIRFLRFGFFGKKIKVK